MKRRRLDAKARTALAALALVLSACAGPESLRVGLKQHAADLVFGIPSLDAALPPNTAPVQGEFLGGSRGPDNLRAPNKGVLGGKPCPSAAFNTVAKNADPNIEGTPAAGRYRWKSDGDFLLAAAVRRFAVPAFETRQVIDVKRLEKNDFTFSTVQKEAWTGDLITSIFEVIFDHPDLQDGIYLTKILRERGSGGTSRTAVFRPKPPILYLGLPVTLAADFIPVPYSGVTTSQEFSSTGVDPDSLDTMSLKGRVIERRRYDACGEMVDGFFVDGEITFTSGSAEPSPSNPTGSASRKAKYNYAIATQYGGLIIFEQIESPCGSYNQQSGKCEPEPQVRYHGNIGQLTPGP